MKKIFLILTIITVVCSSCFKDDNDGVTTSTTTLNGTNVVPVVTTSGTASCKFSYNANTNQVVYQIDYNNLTDSATQFGISYALPGQILPTLTYQLINFGATSLQKRKTGSYSGNFVVDGQQMTLADLQAGKYCVYLRSKAFNTGSGEVRGQVVLP